MSVKFLAAAVLFLLATGTGMLCSKNVLKRISLLKESAAALRKMAFRLQVSGALSDSLLKEFLFPLFKCRESFSRPALCSSILSSALSGSEKDLLCSYVNSMGKEALQGELSECGALAEELLFSAKGDEEESRKKARLYLNFGVLGGIFAIILIF